MSSTFDAELKALPDDVLGLENRLSKLADALVDAKPEQGPVAMGETVRALLRIVTAAKRIRKMCPACNRPDAKKVYVAVNKLSGVWRRDECPTCKDLAAVIHAFEKAAGVHSSQSESEE
ncbi:MAG: hypothetical protein AB7Q17_03060 [Phycisphaerae bacterium]